MNLQRDLDGLQLAQKLTRLQFSVVRQRGNHVMLRHEPMGETVTIPAHPPLKVGTLASIFRDLMEITGLSRDELLRQ